MRKKNTTKIVNNIENIVPALPGVLLCLMTALIFVGDICLPGMKDLQYTVYPALFNTVNCMVLLAGIICIVNVKKSGLKPGREDHLKLLWLFFALFFAAIIISTAVNGLTREAVYGIPYRHLGVFHTLMLISIYPWMSALVKKESTGRQILAAYILIADAVAISALINQYVTDINAYQDKKDLAAIFFNGNHYGYFLVMAVLIGLGLLLFESGELKYIGAISAVLNFIVLIINHSMGCLLSVILVGAAALISTGVRDPEKRKSVLLIFGGLALMTGLALCLSADLRSEISTFIHDVGRLAARDTDGSIGHNRMKQWVMTLGLIKQRPILGYGCEGIAFYLYNELGVSNPHSELLTYAAYYGIPAAVLYTFGVISVFVRHMHINTYNPVSKAACMAAAGYFFSSLVGTAMFYTTPFFFLFLGMALACHEAD